MANEAALVDYSTGEGLYVGADHVIEVVIYANKALTTVLDTGSWTLVTLDIRRKDTSATISLSKNGTRSGTFNSDPDVNTQIWSFALSDDDLAATVFPGDEFEGRCSVWRKDAGSEQPVFFGDAPITRTTQATT